MQFDRNLRRATESKTAPDNVAQIGDGHLRKPVEKHRQHHMRHRTACNMRSLTEMRTVAKGLMRLPFPLDLKGFAIFIAVLVPVGAGLNGHDRIALRNMETTDFRILHHQP